MRDRDTGPSRPQFRQITLAALKTTHDELSATHSNPGDVSQIMANKIVTHYLGQPWFDKYVKHTSRHSTYLGVDNNAPLPAITTGILRYLEFAEALLNLQNVEEFETVLDELSHGKVESACGELDIARMLASFAIKFQFVRPNKGTKLNYDFEIFYPDGLKVCAEAAAKFESTKPRAKSITTSLRDSRDQLPDDQPSIILVKVPERWIRDVELARQIMNVANGYLNQSEHIMSVKFYAPVTEFTSERTARLHAYCEISNPKFSERNWDMFRDENVPVDGRPPWWIRIF
jgi:hypothetical protein